MGAVFMPFVEAPEAFIPDGDVGTKEKSTDPNKMKPKELRNAQEFRNAALREGAFLGTLHLPISYAGPFKSVTDKLRRSRDRMQRHRVFLEGKVTVKFNKFSCEVPGDEDKEVPDGPPPKKGVIEMRMREMMEKKWDIIIKCGPPKVQKAMKAAYDFKKGDWKRECKDKEAKQKVVTDYWASLWHAKTEFVRNQQETEQLEKELKELKEKHPDSKTMLQELCEKGCDVNAARDDDMSNFTALMTAARNGNLETVEALLELPDIDVNKTNAYGANAMHYAAMYAHKEVCQALRKGKVDRKVKNAAGKIPKQLAMDEHEDLHNHKKEQWGAEVYKAGKFKLVEEFGKKDKEDDLIYNKVFGVHKPDAVEPDKEWKPGKWRISLIPDPACKLDDFSERDFMKRWKSTAKKLP